MSVPRADPRLPDTLTGHYEPRCRLIEPVIGVRERVSLVVFYFVGSRLWEVAFGRELSDGGLCYWGWGFLF